MIDETCGLGEGTHYACECVLKRLAAAEASLSALRDAVEALAGEWVYNAEHDEDISAAIAKRGCADDLLALLAAPRPAGESAPVQDDGSYEYAYTASLDILQIALEGLPEAEADLPMPRMARRAAAAITRLRSQPSPSPSPAPAEERPNPTHRCKVCGALWIKLPPDPLGGWSLWSKKCGPCCDNVEMGEQIEPITNFRHLCDPGPMGEPAPAEDRDTRLDRCECGHAEISHQQEGTAWPKATCSGEWDNLCSCRKFRPTRTEEDR